MLQALMMATVLWITPVPSGVQVDPGLCQPSQRVEVYWGDRWWNAIVTGLPTKDGRCPISYENYDASWDEAVPASRIRLRSAPVAGQSLSGG